MQTGLSRDNKDKFYTKKEVAETCISLVMSNILDINIDKDLIIEPSAGNGSFIPSIKNSFRNFIFFDLYPENPEIIKQDYLTLNVNSYSNYRKIHVIGNPPFGRQSSLAIKFIKKSAEFCDSINFILPKSFKKESLKKHFPLNFHLKYQVDIENNSFLVNEVEYDVPCVFQVWEKSIIPRNPIQNIELLNFIFVKKHEDPDISIRRVGWNAGAVSIEIEDKNTNTHYFLKQTKTKNFIDINCLINKISSIKFNFNNSVGPRSISKQELIIELNKIS